MKTGCPGVSRGSLFDQFDSFMIKYVPEMTSVVFEEIPDMVSLAVDISNCLGKCEGCHSPFLRGDVGTELTPSAVDSLISSNFGINCFLFLGEGSDNKAFMGIARYVRETYPQLRLAVYSGRNDVEDDIYDLFDYVKIGPYMPSSGPLNVRTTNQRLFQIIDGKRSDMTFRFWHRGIDPNVK